MDRVLIDMPEQEGRQRTGALRRWWMRWKRVGTKIGDSQARLLLGLFYYVVFAPFAIVVRWFCDPLGLKDNRPKGWQARGEDEDAPEKRGTRQF